MHSNVLCICSFFYNAKRYYTVRNVWLFSAQCLVRNAQTELLGCNLTYAGLFRPKMLGCVVLTQCWVKYKDFLGLSDQAAGFVPF